MTKEHEAAGVEQAMGQYVCKSTGTVENANFVTLCSRQPLGKFFSIPGRATFDWDHVTCPTCLARRRPFP